MFKTMRLNKNWSQEQLSRKSGVSVRTIQRIENGHQANNDTLSKLAKCYQLTIEELKNKMHQHISEISIADDQARSKRLHFLDNLRVFLIFLVVIYHCGIVYESSGIGAVFWLVDDPATNNIVGIVNLVIDVFVMAGLFFIAGYFTPSGIYTHGISAFIKEKVKRILLPWFFACFTLLPMYKFIFLYSRGESQHELFTYFHFSNGVFSQSWLWFLPVLFAFYCIYSLLIYARLPFARITIKTAVIWIFSLGWLYSVLFSTMGLTGWTKTWIFDFQQERLFIYFLYFTLGAVCYHQKVFNGAWQGSKLFYSVNYLSWLPITSYLVLILIRILSPQTVLISQFIDDINVRLSFHLSLLVLLYSLICYFRKYANFTNGKLTLLRKTSYGIYLVHVIILGIVATMLLQMPIPSVAKYLLLSVISYGASFYLVLGFVTHLETKSKAK